MVSDIKEYLEGAYLPSSDLVEENELRVAERAKIFAEVRVLMGCLSGVCFHGSMQLTCAERSHCALVQTVGTNRRNLLF